MHVVLFIFTCICLGWKEWRGRCKRRRLSYVSPFSGTICCFACLEPQQNWIVAFTTNRGQRLHPLVEEFLLRCSSEYFFCSGHSDHTLACSFLLRLRLFFWCFPPRFLFGFLLISTFSCCFLMLICSIMWKLKLPTLCLMKQRGKSTDQHCKSSHFREIG